MSAVLTNTKVNVSVDVLSKILLSGFTVHTDKYGILVARRYKYNDPSQPKNIEVKMFEDHAVVDTKEKASEMVNYDKLLTMQF